MTSSVPAIGESAVRGLWQELIERYGSAVTTTWGTSPPAAWVEAVGALDRDSLRRGVQKLRTRHEWDDPARLRWPPTLDEFLSWCRMPRRPPAAHLEFAPPPKEAMTEAERRIARAKLREIVKGLVRVRAR